MIKRALFFVATACMNGALLAGPPTGSSSGSPLLDLVVPEFEVQDVGFIEALRTLGQKYGLQFGIEVITQSDFREPRVSVQARGKSLAELIDHILIAARLKPFVVYSSTAAADLLNIQIGQRPPDYELDWTVDFETHCESNPYNTIRWLPYNVQRLRARFVAPSTGLIGSEPGAGQGFCFKDEGIVVRDLLNQIALRQNGLDWVVIYREDSVAQTQWHAFF